VINRLISSDSFFGFENKLFTVYGVNREREQDAINDEREERLIPLVERFTNFFVSFLLPHFEGAAF